MVATSADKAVQAISLRADAQANRQRLLDAARGSLLESGLALDVRDVASRAGVGMGTFYRNFRTKEDLIQLLVEDIATEFEEIVRRAWENPDPVASFAGFVHDFDEFGVKYARWYDLRSRIGSVSRARPSWSYVEKLILRATEADAIDPAFTPTFVTRALLALATVNVADKPGEESPYTSLSTRLFLQGLQPIRQRRTAEPSGQ